MELLVGNVLTNFYEAGFMKLVGNIHNHTMPNNTIGRFVKLVQVSLQYLNLCEVEVYASLGMFLMCHLLIVYR